MIGGLDDIIQCNTNFKYQSQIINSWLCMVLPAESFSISINALTTSTVGCIKVSVSMFDTVLSSFFASPSPSSGTRNFAICVWAALKNVGLPSNNKFTSKSAVRLFHSRLHSDLWAHYGISWQHFNTATHHWTTLFWLCPARFALIDDRCYGVTL